MQEDDRDRWPTVNLQPDQLEQVLATEFVETMRIDPPDRMVPARPAGGTPAKPGTIRYGGPLVLSTLTIVLGGVALLLNSSMLRVQAAWRLPVVVVLWLLALAALGGAVALLVRAVPRVKDGA